MEEPKKTDDMGLVRDYHGRFVAGTIGRPRGVKNKYTLFKEAMLEAASRLGKGSITDWLVQFAADHPTDFFRGIVNLLPRETILSMQIDRPKKQLVIFMSGDGKELPAGGPKLTGVYNSGAREADADPILLEQDQGQGREQGQGPEPEG